MRTSGELYWQVELGGERGKQASEVIYPLLFPLMGCLRRSGSRNLFSKPYRIMKISIAALIGAPGDLGINRFNKTVDELSTS